MLSIASLPSPNPPRYFIHSVLPVVLNVSETWLSPPLWLKGISVLSLIMSQGDVIGNQEFDPTSFTCQCANKLAQDKVRWRSPTLHPSNPRLRVRELVCAGTRLRNTVPGACEFKEDLSTSHSGSLSLIKDGPGPLIFAADFLHWKRFKNKFLLGSITFLRSWVIWALRVKG